MKKKIYIALAFCISILLMAYAFKIKTYTSSDDYLKAGGTSVFDIPDTATDCTFAIRNQIISKAYLYAFTLDEDSYNQYMDQLISTYNLTSDNDKEQLYGYAHWFGMQVADCQDSEYTLNNFPTGLPFNEVTDTPIEDYYIIVYSPRGSGSHSYGVVTDKDTFRVVCFDFYAR